MTMNPVNPMNLVSAIPLPNPGHLLLRHRFAKVKIKIKTKTKTKIKDTKSPRACFKSKCSE